MKPAWDKLAEEFKDSPVVGVYDVDCTAAGEKLCSKVGVDGYPTIKYYLPDAPKPKDYQGGRDFDGLKKFVEKTFKPACNVLTKENCDEKQTELIDSLRSKSPAEITAHAQSLKDEVEKKKEERLKFIDEGKKKIKALKAEEEDLALRQRMAQKLVDAKNPKEEL